MSKHHADVTLMHGDKVKFTVISIECCHCHCSTL